jgi:protein disulfide-isomerase
MNYATPNSAARPVASTAAPMANAANPSYPAMGAGPVTGTGPVTGAGQAYPPSQPMVAQPAPAVAAMAPAYTGAPAAVPSGMQQLGVSAQSPVNPRPATAAVQAPPTTQPLALDCYCPVTLTEKQQWMPGDRRWGAIHRGRTYLFAGPEEQRRFFTDPDRYAPVVAGNDIVLATEQGQAVPGMREHGVFFGNRIYLFSSEATLEKFSKNPGQYAAQTMGTASLQNSYGQQTR